ncbi:hypothetical protein [Nonomuraea sp. NPDC050540]|uniref:hypothetical protein n=1 Tax=Nonomuraea sp. NPDC050540 TaxID=3364367 RepID=UPI00379F65C8
MSATDEAPEYAGRRVLPHDAARLLVAELAARGVDADLQPFFQGRAWVSLWGGLLVSCDGLLFSWITGANGATPIWDHAPADDPSTAAAKLVTRYDELRAQHPTHGRPLPEVADLRAAVPQ